MAGSSQTCDNCGRAIGRLEHPLPWQGHTVCYECHARLARASETAPPETPAAAESDSSIVSTAPIRFRKLHKHDDVQWHGSPSTILYLPLYSLFAVLAAAAVTLAFWFWGFLIFFPVFVLLFIGWEIRRRSYKFFITADRLIAETGIVTRQRRELHLTDIREATLNQTLIGRILDFGDLMIDTSAQAGEEIRMQGIRHPAEVLKLLNAFRK
jgi:hypothetical protein